MEITKEGALGSSVPTRPHNSFSRSILRLQSTSLTLRVAQPFISVQRDTTGQVYVWLCRPINGSTSILSSPHNKDIWGGPVATAMWCKGGHPSTPPDGSSPPPPRIYATRIPIVLNVLTFSGGGDARQEAFSLLQVAGAKADCRLLWDRGAHTTVGPGPPSRLQKL